MGPLLWAFVDHECTIRKNEDFLVSGLLLGAMHSMRREGNRLSQSRSATEVILANTKVKVTGYSFTQKF